MSYVGFPEVFKAKNQFKQEFQGLPSPESVPACGSDGWNLAFLSIAPLPWVIPGNETLQSSLQSGAPFCRKVLERLLSE